VSVGDFETIEIGAHSADALFASSAYHWISPAAQLDRPALILRPGGVLAIVEGVQVDSPEDRGFYAAAQPIYERYGQHHKGPPSPQRNDVDGPIRAELEADDRFEHVAVRRYDWDQTYTAAQYRDLMMSVSPILLMEAPAQQQLLDAMEAFIREDFADCVVRPLVAALTTATLAA